MYASGRLLALDHDGGAPRLHLFDAASGERLAWTASDYFDEADMALSPDATQVYVGESASSSSCLSVYEVVGDALVKLREQPFGQCADLPGRGLVTVPGSTDVFWGRGRWRTDDLTRVFALAGLAHDDAIRTVTPDARLAIGRQQVYDAASGELLGTLPAPAPAQAVDLDGHTLLVNGPNGRGVARVELDDY
jgi:hypothetical protein